MQEGLRSLMANVLTLHKIARYYGTPVRLGALLAKAGHGQLPGSCHAPPPLLLSPLQASLPFLLPPSQHSTHAAVLHAWPAVPSNQSCGVGGL